MLFVSNITTLTVLVGGVRVMFTSPKSFVDSPFFVNLSKHKLENAKLSDVPIPLKGLISTPRAPERVPALRLAHESFNAQAQTTKPLEFEVPGIVMNLNTIEQFKDMDKLALLREETHKLHTDIVSGKVLENPALLSKFLLLTFADLKRYKFYYWFAFPTFKWTSKIVESEREPSPELDKLMSQCTQPVIQFSNGQITQLRLDRQHVELGLCDFGSLAASLPSYIRNLAALLNHYQVETADIYIYRLSGGSRWIKLDVGAFSSGELAGENSEGWERNAQNKLMPKLTDLSSLMNPLQLANEAVDLNLKLMKWRAAPQIDLDSIAGAKCLLLGAGTLGTYVSRGLMAWGVKHITFVDNGTVSYSNPVRQPLYTHEDCIGHAPKAETAARALKQIFPGVTSSGHELEIPMVGHSITNAIRQHQDHEKLTNLIATHDVVFLLMDSRESRWLPTVISSALNKITINVALGFDSYLAMRHGVERNLGCYFCNDIVAPADSISRQTLDQMCTVTRPGCAMIASGYAVELLARIFQHPDRGKAPNDADTVLGPVSHQLRGYLSSQETLKVWGPAFPNCSACGPAVELWNQHGWEFVERVMNNPGYLAECSGLLDLQRQTEDLELDSDEGLE